MKKSKLVKIVCISLCIFGLLLTLVILIYYFKKKKNNLSFNDYKHPVINCDKNITPSLISLNNKIDISKIVINNLINNTSSNILENIFKDFKTEKGLFYFAPSPLFNPYPIDFGMSKDTPYGIVTIPKWGERVKNDNIRFEYLGLLGAYNLKYDEAVIMYGEIDKKELNIFYQSISSYLVDRENIVLNSSTNPALNNINSKFAIIQTPNKALEKYLTSILKFYVDNIYSFILGSKKGSQPLYMYIPKLANNSLFSRLYKQESDRVTMIMRIFTKTTSKKYNEFLRNPNIEVIGIKVPDIKISLVTRDKYPKPIKVIFNELQDNFTVYMDSLITDIKQALKSYKIINLPILSNLLKLVTKGHKNIDNEKIIYKEGLQGIQLYANLQGDNRDAWYKGTNTFCCNNKDIIIAVCVNHAFLKNCKFCSLDVYDSNDHILIESVNTMKFTAYNFFYLVFVSRDQVLLNNFKDKFQYLLIPIFLIHIKTGLLNDLKTPSCNPIQIIEKSYLAPSNIKEVFTHPNGMLLLNPIIIKISPNN